MVGVSGWRQRCLIARPGSTHSIEESFSKCDKQDKLISVGDPIGKIKHSCRHAVKVSLGSRIGPSHHDGVRVVKHLVAESGNDEGKLYYFLRRGNKTNIVHRAGYWKLDRCFCASGSPMPISPRRHGERDCC